MYETIEIFKSYETNEIKKARKRMKYKNGTKQPSFNKNEIIFKKLYDKKLLKSNHVFQQ